VYRVVQKPGPCRRTGEGEGGEGGGATGLLAGLAFEPRTKSPRDSIKLNHPAAGLEGEFAPGALPVADKKTGKSENLLYQTNMQSTCENGPSEAW
jgi:hypothetical protein